MKKVLSLILSLVILVTSMTCFGLANAFASRTPYSLSVDGYKDREVISFNCEFDKLDDEGNTTDVTKGGKITIKVPALKDGTPDLLAWMVDSSLAKNGKITVLDAKSGKASRSIEFTDAYCVNYEEVFNTKPDGTLEHYEEITISCKTINFGNVQYESAWA